MMAAKSHWVTEVFPVKFSLQDLLCAKEGEGNDGLGNFNFKAKDHYQDACNRVISSMDRSPKKTSADPLKVPDENSLEDRKEMSIISTDQNEVLLTHSNRGDLRSRASQDRGCIWTKEELDIFRNGFFHLKKRSVHLLLLLSESKEEVKELKKKCREKRAVISKQSSKLSEQNKQNMKLNATIRELKSDLECSEQKIQQMFKMETQLREHNRFLINELEHERKELAKTREMCVELDKALENQQKEITSAYGQQEAVLKTKLMHNVEKVEKERKQLRKELEKERSDHQLTKAALAQLRKHFVSMQATASPQGFLDVTSIDYFSQ